MPSGWETSPWELSAFAELGETLALELQNMERTAIDCLFEEFSSPVPF